MEKSPEAFRTISEVAEFLDTPAHVLRFWESRFPQIRPVKRAGGRRYYRPGDVALLSGIKRLLHDEGMTIRGVQKILREHGIRHVAGLSGPDMPEADVEAILAAEFGPKDEPSLPPVEAQTAQIISLEAALVRHEAARAEPIQPELWPADPVDNAADTGGGGAKGHLAIRSRRCGRSPVYRRRRKPRRRTVSFPCARADHRCACRGCVTRA